jgi:hypothetical protein
MEKDISQMFHGLNENVSRTFCLIYVCAVVSNVFQARLPVHMHIICCSNAK